MPLKQTHFPFNLRKAIEAVAVLIKAHKKKSANYLRLQKLLYMAERNAFKNMGEPIVGDVFFALPRGPVLSETLNLMEERRSNELWNKHFRRAGKFDLQLISDPGRDALSDLEVELLEKAASENKYKDVWSVVDLTHEFPEWEKNFKNDRAKEIPLNDLLDAIGLRQESKHILAEAAYQQKFDALLGKEGGE